MRQRLTNDARYLQRNSSGTRETHARYARDTHADATLLQVPMHQLHACAALCLCPPVCYLRRCDLHRPGQALSTAALHCIIHSAHTQFSLAVSTMAMASQLKLLPQQAMRAPLRNYHEVSRTVPPRSFGLNHVAQRANERLNEPDLLVRWPPGQIIPAKHRLGLLQRERAVGRGTVARSRSR